MQQLQPEPPSLIEELLAEQRLLTAVTKFSQKHERAELPLQSRFYRDLIPLSRPAPGEQYAFEVDLDKCSGCKACVAACHSLNGLEPGESWRTVGTLVNPESAPPFQQPVTTACHHCLDPACANGCPVLAYEKDPITGIVRHLDDQCIGCQYCILKCPYEVPKYSSNLGIVRKCDMCASRLESGEAPACVQSCPSEAIRITIIATNAVADRGSATRSVEIYSTSSNTFLPASPDPTYSMPATRYLSSKGLAQDLVAANENHLTPSDPHWPLVFMLVLTQTATGGLLFATALPQSHPGLITSAAVFGLVGIAASILHLGKPLKAWRSFLGVRRSWLSREILAFNVFALTLLLLLAQEVLPFSFIPQQLLTILSASIGSLALACSIMVYHDTPREFWNWKRTVPRFIGSTLVLGAALGILFIPHEPLLSIALAAASALKIISELRIFRSLDQPQKTALQRTALLMSKNFRLLTAFRFLSLFFFGLLAPLFALAGNPHLSPATSFILFSVLLLSELSERYLFFRTVSQPIMPGALP